MEMELRSENMEFKSEDGALKVSGYVNKVGKWSQPLGKENRFVEQIKPGTFAKALQNGNDIDLLAEHDSSKLLASTKNGSLVLREDEIGLHMEARISPTSYGKDYHTLIKEGIIQNMSFGMQVLKDTWKKRADGLLERSIEELKLFEVSAVKNGAYSDSEVFTTRSINVIDEPTINLTEEYTMKKTEKQLMEERAAIEAELSERGIQATDKVETRTTDSAGEVEKRAFEEFMQGKAETRALTIGTGAGQTSAANTVQTSIANEIVTKVNENSNLFKDVPMIATRNTGNIDVLREDIKGEAAFHGELETISLQDFDFKKVTLEQRRAGAAVELSQNLINDTEVNIAEYAVGIIGDRVAERLDKAMVNGKVVKKEIQGIYDAFETVDLGIEKAVFASATDITVEDLLNMEIDFPDKYKNGAKWVVNRETYKKIAKLKDGDGNYLMVRDIVDGKPAKKLFDMPIVINTEMENIGVNKRPIALVNFTAAYRGLQRGEIKFNHVSDDTTQALRGSHLFVCQIYTDAKVVDPQAIIMGVNPAV